MAVSGGTRNEDLRPLGQRTPISATAGSVPTSFNGFPAASVMTRTVPRTRSTARPSSLSSEACLKVFSERRERRVVLGLLPGLVNPEERLRGGGARPLRCRRFRPGAKDRSGCRCQKLSPIGHHTSGGFSGDRPASPAEAPEACGRN